MAGTSGSSRAVGGRVLQDVAINDGSGAQITSFGGTSMTDDNAFTPASSSVTPAGAIFDDTSTDSVDEGDVGAFRMTSDRQLLTVAGIHPSIWHYHVDGSSALTDASVKAAPAAGFSIYVGTIVVSSGAATAMNVFFEEGSTKVLGPYYLEAVAGRGLVINFNPPKKITAATALTVTTSAAIAHSVDVTGFVAPG